MRVSCLVNIQPGRERGPDSPPPTRQLGSNLPSRLPKNNILHRNNIHEEKKTINMENLSLDPPLWG